MRVVKNERYGSEKERKAERVVELLDTIDESFIEETYKIDTAEKLRAEKQKEATQRRAKVLRSPDTRRWLTAAACFVLTFGILLGGFSLLEKLLDPIEPPKITDNRYPPVSLPSLEDMGKDAITSLDMLNYYSAMKALGEGTESNKASVGRTYLSAGGESENSDDTLGDVVPLPEVKDEIDENLVYYYELDENEVFTVTKAVYFQIKLTDEKGFLAQKIGTGTVDVVITENSLEPMITFRNGNRFYSCLLNTIENFEDEKRDEEITNYVFSTHKYIEGFYIVKNLAQENYGFKISFDEAGQAMSFDCTSYKTGGTIPDGAIEILTQTLSRELNIEFTIEQLERYFELGGFGGVEKLEEGFHFELNEDGQTYYVSKFVEDENTPTEVVIPSEYNGLPVTAIGKRAFSGCKRIEKVIIPDGIISIGYSAFKICVNLIDITIPDTVTSIGGSAFSQCRSLESIKLPNNLTVIESHLFELCKNLKSITVPDSVKIISGSAFEGCESLETVFIGSGVEKIGREIFRNCKNILSITVDENNLYFKSIDGSLYDKNVTYLIQYAIKKSDTHFIVPDGVERIADFAFAYCSSLQKVILPDSVYIIGFCAFGECDGLTEIVSLNNIKSIGDGIFMQCSGLTSVEIPQGVNRLKSNMFAGCDSLTMISIPDSVISIDGYALHNTEKLAVIKYSGTIDQWKNIEKSYGWDSMSGEYTVYCTDGIITKSGEPFPIESKDLEFQITQCVEGYDFSEYTSIPGFGVIQYYGKGYKYDDKYYVCYDVTAYPDYADGGEYVTRIEITDPAISIYGLTVNSTFEEFQKVFGAMGYTISYISKNTINAEKDGISISFTISDARIMRIRAEITNRDGIIF